LAKIYKERKGNPEERKGNPRRGNPNALKFLISFGSFLFLE